MKALQKVESLIKKRFSCRNFLPTQIPESVKLDLQVYMKSEETQDCFFTISYSPRYNHDYIIAHVNPSTIDSLSFGIGFERIILYCTQLNLSTCWTGVFPQHHFQSISDVPTEYPIGMVSPIGYPTRIPTPKRKKSWEEIFFHNTPSAPLQPTVIPAYTEPHEMVRIAPSGINLQPWRVLFRDQSFHFFVERNKGIIGIGFKTLLLDLQLIDMGIAVCHFELSTKARNLQGQWVQDPPSWSIPKEWNYVRTWQCE